MQTASAPRFPATPAARHPFRRAFAEAGIARARRHDDSDIKLFALSFTAFFVCFYTFIV